MNLEDPSPTIRGALIGALTGLVVGLGLWWLNGLFVGLSNDYQMYRRYDSEASLIKKLVLAIPVCAALGAFIGHQLGISKPR